MVIAKHLINGLSVKGEMDKVLKRRGMQYKKVITKYFAKTLKLESFFKKNVSFTPTLYEETGHEYANFLFSKRKEGDDGDAIYYADAIFAYNLMAGNPTNYNPKGAKLAILSALTKDYFDNKVDEISTQGNITLEDILSIDLPDDFFVVLEQCDLSDQMVLDAMRLYHNFAEYCGYISALFAQITALIHTKLPEFEEQIKSQTKRISTELAKDSKGFLYNNFHVSLDDGYTYSIYPGIFQVNSASLWGVGLSECYVVIGLHILDLISTLNSLDNSAEAAEEFLKCLSDSTKLGILKLLKDGSMYGAQLAEKLNCTSSNISHHMNTLLNLDLISIQQEKNRVYLHLNKDAIHKHLDDAKGLFG